MTTYATAGQVPQWTVGDRLRKARTTTGLTAKAFADEIGISTKTALDAESDKRAPRRITLLAYAMRSGVPVEWLETGNAPQPKPGGEGLYTARDSNPEPADSAIAHPLAEIHHLPLAA